MSGDWDRDGAGTHSSTGGVQNTNSSLGYENGDSGSRDWERDRERDAPRRSQSPRSRSPRRERSPRSPRVRCVSLSPLSCTFSNFLLCAVKTALPRRQKILDQIYLSVELLLEW